MPRSGYDSTNCTNLQDARRNRQVARSSTDISSSNSSQSSPSPSSSSVSSTATSSTTTSIESSQGHLTPTSRASSASTSINPTSCHSTTRLDVDRTLLPTVRVSPGYVENTGGYRVYNNSTGRGWRYSQPTGGSAGPVPSGGEREPDATIPEIKNQENDAKLRRGLGKA